MKSEQKDQESSLQKFISLMKSLTKFIKEDFSHQETIYQCLNSQQLKRLLDSIHDECFELRMTSIKFIGYLLYNNRKIIQILSTMQGYDYTGDHKKYIIGGLDYYLNNRCPLRDSHRTNHKQNQIPPLNDCLGNRPQQLQNYLLPQGFQLVVFVRSQQLCGRHLHEGVGEGKEGSCGQKQVQNKQAVIFLGSYSINHSKSNGLLSNGLCMIIR